jgi:hypothetical protein
VDANVDHRRISPLPGGAVHGCRAVRRHAKGLRALVEGRSEGNVVDDANRLDGDDSLSKILNESTKPILVPMAGPDDMFRRKTRVLRGTPDLRASITLAPNVSSAIGDARIPD